MKQNKWTIIGLVIVISLFGIIGYSAIQRQKRLREIEEIQNELKRLEAERIAEAKKRAETDFRNVCWGDDIAVVQGCEKEITHINDIDNGLSCACKFGTEQEYNTTLYYNFDDAGKLRNANYLVHTTASDGTQYIEHFLNLKDDLIKMYGKPKEDTSESTLFSLKANANDTMLGVKVNSGSVGFMAEWATEKSNVRLYLAPMGPGMLGSPTLLIVYYDNSRELDEKDIYTW